MDAVDIESSFFGQPIDLYQPASRLKFKLEKRNNSLLEESREEHVDAIAIN
jgi:hypothetical protein